MNFNLPDPGIILYSGAFGLIVIGILGIVLSRHLFRILLALAIAEAGANMLLVLAGYRFDAIAPIVMGNTAGAATMVDPVPQAMVLTAIVIGVGIQALALSLIIQVYRVYGTLDLRVLSNKLEHDIAEDAGVMPGRSQDEPLPDWNMPVSASVVAQQGADS